MGNDESEGDQYRLQIQHRECPTATIGPPITADRQFQNTAPELALVYKLNPEWQFRGRVATGYGTPQVGNLFVLSNGQNGNNTQLKTQQNLGYDLGFDWTPNNALTLSATGFYEFFKNELVTQATPVGAPNASFTFNAPRSEHRGVEIAADWKFYPGWRFTAAYTYLDEVYTEYTENITNGAVFSFNRAGNKIPGISPNELTARLGYDQMWGPLAGLGAFVEVQWKESFYMDNANLLKAPGYELVNLNVHYKTDLDSDYFKSLNLYFEVRNVFDRTYVASANNIANTVTGSRRSKSRERAGEHHRLDLRRFAARIHGRNEGGIQMIGRHRRRSKAMLRMSLLATLAFCALANGGPCADEPSSACLGSGVRGCRVAVRVESHPRLRVRMERCGSPGWPEARSRWRVRTTPGAAFRRRFR